MDRWPSNSLASNQEVNINSNYIAPNSHERAPEQTNSVEEVQQIVTFHNDAAVIPEHFPAEKILSPFGNEQHRDSINHSIITFMERPQYIELFNWTKDQRIGSIIKDTDRLLKYDIPAVGLTPMILNKLDGITSFRATAVIRLQMNSQPFQQGRLILAAIPVPFLIGQRADYLQQHPSFLQSVNHVQVDISKQTEVTLRVPFVSPFNSFDLISNKYQWARVVCMVYSKLEDPFGNGCPIQVWVHFENIELGTATSGEYAKVDGYAIEQAGSVLKDPPQSAVKQTREVEETGKIVGLAHSITDGAATLVNSVGNAVPFLKPITDIFSSLAGPTKTFASNLLGFLGFSKPQVAFAGSTILERPCESFCNANGPDHSHILALDRLNNVDVYPGLGGTLFDEQDLNYLTRIPQFVGQFVYTTNSVSSMLWSTYVSPTYFVPGYITITGGQTPCESGIETGTFDAQSIQELQPTILNYVSSFFVYWTGSLVYTFRFVKTNYHSGRVEISFHPFTNNVKTDRINYAYRTIIDLRETTEVSLTVPYVAPQPWKRVIPASPLSDAKWEDYGPAATGRLVVRAITPLIRSSAVISNEVHCVVEVRAGDDYRLSTPVASSYLGFTLDEDGIPQMEKEGGNSDSESWDSQDCKNWDPRDPRRPDHCFDDIAIEQSGPYALPGTSETRTSAIEGFSPPSITTSEIDSHRSDTQMFCAGEMFQNYRSLIKKFSFVRMEHNFKTYRQSLTISAAPYIRAPRLTSVAYQFAGNSGPLANSFEFEWGHSPLSQVGMMYAFYRGGIRFKIFAPQSQNLISGRCVNKYDLISPIVDRDGKVLPSDPIWAGKNVFNPLNANIAYEMVKKEFAEFQIPFYSPVMLAVPNDIIRQAEFDQSSCALNLSFYTPRKVENESLTPDLNHMTNVHIAVAGADDMTFHSFVGLPPIVSKTRFSIMVTKVTCSAEPANPIVTEAFQQVSYQGTHSQSDPCLDTEIIKGSQWLPKTPIGIWLGIRLGADGKATAESPVKVSVDDIQGTKAGFVNFPGRSFIQRYN